MKNLSLFKIIIIIAFASVSTFPGCSLFENEDNLNMKTLERVQRVEEFAAGMGSGNANLANIEISEGMLSPSFDPDRKTYFVGLPNLITSVTLNAMPEDSNSRIEINGAPYDPGVESDPISLFVGNNIINILVTSEDGSITSTYTITAERAPSDNANLANLVVSEGVLDPNFVPLITTYD